MTELKFKTPFNIDKYPKLKELLSTSNPFKRELQDSNIEDAYYSLIDLTENYDTGETIGAFTKMLYLANIDVLNYVTDIPDSCFRGTDLISIVIPDNIQKIGWTSFGGCKNLESVTIPNSVAYMDLGAFTDCNKLTDIYYYGTTDEFENAFEDEDWLAGSSIKHIRCTNGSFSVR